MEFKIDRDIFLKSLAHVQGVVEKKNTLPILGNVLIEAHDSFIKLTATDLDIIISEKISAQVIKEGSTTTTAQVIYDIVRKLSPGKKINPKVQSTYEILSNLPKSENFVVLNFEIDSVDLLKLEQPVHKRYLWEKIKKWEKVEINP